MSELVKKNVSKQTSVPLALSPRHKHLSQTRRHSWFGTAQDIPSLNTPNEKVPGMYDIKEDDENTTKEDTNSSSWWKIQNWSNGNEENKKCEVRQRRSNVIAEVTNLNRINDKIKKRTQFVGLERKEKTSLNSKPKTVETENEPVAKRRSGLGNWLVNGKSFESKENNSDNEQTSTPKPKPRFDPRQNSVGKESRAYSRRATVHYSSNGRPSLMDLKRRTLQQPLKANELRALEQLKDICRDVIAYRLRQRNLASRVFLDREQSKERWLFRDVIFIFRQLERTHQCRYSDISKQIGITLRSEEVLRKVFFELSGEIITTELNKNLQNGNENTHEPAIKKPIKPETTSLLTFGSRITEITWGRLCAVLAIAGGLAIDCVQQGHADLVNRIIDYIGDFAREEDVLPWIVEQGGWENLREMTYDVTSRNVNSDPCYFKTFTNTAIAFVFCTVSTVVAALSIVSFTSKGQK